MFLRAGSTLQNRIATDSIRSLERNALSTLIAFWRLTSKIEMEQQRTRAILQNLEQKEQAMQAALEEEKKEKEDALEKNQKVKGEELQKRVMEMMLFQSRVTASARPWTL